MNDFLHMYRQIDAALRSVQTHLTPESAGHEAFQQARQDHEQSLRNTSGFTGKIFEKINDD